MSLKENFLQAAQELAGAPAPKDPAANHAAPAPISAAHRPLAQEDAPRRTVIAEGTVIHGSIHAGGSLELYGAIYGDVSAQEDLKLSGKLEGNATGQNIEVCGGRVKGNLQSGGRVRVARDCVVLGNIRADALLLNGRIKGDLEVKNSVALDVHAAVSGNVTAGKLSIAEGAVLQGGVRIASADLSKLFDGGGKSAAQPAAPSKPPQPEPPAPQAERKPDAATPEA